MWCGSEYYRREDKGEREGGETQFRVSSGSFLDHVCGLLAGLDLLLPCKRSNKASMGSL